MIGKVNMVYFESGYRSNDNMNNNAKDNSFTMC